MKQFPALLFALCPMLSDCLFAQVTPDEFGMVKPEYLSMTTYGTDAQAEAVVLYDFGKTYFYDSDYGFRIIFERTRKIKILTKAGLSYAAVEIPYYVENNQMENVYDIDGYTFTMENGSLKRTRLDSKTTYDEKLNDHWMVKKFAMPDVKEGSVIEYKYKVMSPYYVNLYDWEFQSRIPTVYSEYTVGMIPFYEYSYIFQGAKKFDVFRNTQSALKRNYRGVEFPDNNFTFGMKNIPAFRDEAYITSINDYIMKMDFQLAVVHHMNGAKVDFITTWPLLFQELQKNSDFGTYLKAGEKSAAEILPALNLGSKTDREKAGIITRYVKDNFNWNGGNNKFCGQPMKDFLKKKTGNSADINLFLCSMLNASGIEAYPVLLSTRDHGKVNADYPFHQFLNYVIVLVHLDNNPVLLDATESLSPFGMLPARCINEKGLVVNREKVEWIPLTDEVISVASDSVHIVFNESLDSVHVHVSVQSSGHGGLDLRSSYIADPDKFSKGCFNSDMIMRKPIIVKNERETEKPFCYEYAGSVPVEMIADKILIAPFPGLPPDENPLKVGYRSYPVDMIYSKTNHFNSVIEIPKGFKFADQHKEVNIDNALVNITYTTQNSSDKLLVKGSYTFKKAVYLPQEYYTLKGFFTSIVETFNNQIILVRQTE